MRHWDLIESIVSYEREGGKQMNIRIRLFGLTLFEHYHTCDENCIPKNQIAGFLKEHAEQQETIRLLLEERAQFKPLNNNEVPVCVCKDMIFWKIAEQNK